MINIYWKVMIVTRDYEDIVTEIMNYLSCDKQSKIVHAKDYFHATTPLLELYVHPYHESADKFRGIKADIIYIEDDVYDEHGDQWAQFSINAIMGMVKPMRDLRLKLGWTSHI